MSLLQIQRCSNIGCDFPIYKHAGIQSKKRFCKRCQIKSAVHGTVLKWKCTTCENIITDQNVRKRTCDDCKIRHKFAYQKQYQKTYKILLKVKRQKKKKCHICNGSIMMRPDNFCSDYHKWLQWLSHRHYRIILCLDDLK